MLGSKFALWFTLITSGEFGFEREVIEKTTIDRIPLPDFRCLQPADWEKILQLFEDVCRSASAWEDVDRWVASLYGLGDVDLQIITDTLSYNLPFAEIKLAAQARPDPKAAEDFCLVLRKELMPWAKRFNTSLSVRMIASRSTSPWMGFLLQAGANTSDAGVQQHWEALLSVADATAATELMVEDESGALLIGRLAQSRYWSDTQARLLAQHIIWSRLDILKGRGQG